jgi:hypothetical protein
MKEQKQESLDIINSIISNEAKQKSHDVLYELCEKKKTFKIVGFKSKIIYLKDKEVTTYVFCYKTDYIPGAVFESPMKLFTGRLFDTNNQTIQNTNLGILGSLSAKIAFEQELEIQPFFIACKIMDHDTKTMIDVYTYIFKILDKGEY